MSIKLWLPVLKGSSHILQVEFTYIKSGKQVRLKAESGMKTHSHSLYFPLYRRDSSSCSWLLMCGSRAGWKTYCSINHIPFFSAAHSNTRLSETGATLNCVKKIVKMTNKPLSCQIYICVSALLINLVEIAFLCCRSP